jgi:hypothetical protein
MNLFSFVFSVVAFPLFSFSFRPSPSTRVLAGPCSVSPSVCFPLSEQAVYWNEPSSFSPFSSFDSQSGRTASLWFGLLVPLSLDAARRRRSVGAAEREGKEDRRRGRLLFLAKSDESRSLISTASSPLSLHKHTERTDEAMPAPAVLLALLLGAVAAYFLLIRSSSTAAKPDPFTNGSGKTGANSGTTATGDVDTGRDFVAHMRLAVRSLPFLAARKIAQRVEVRKGWRRCKELVGEFSSSLTAYRGSDEDAASSSFLRNNRGGGASTRLIRSTVS